MLYSDSLLKYEGEISQAVSEAIHEIKSYFKNGDLVIYKWDDYSIVVSAKFEVSLPSRGSFNNLILSNEPILIQISLARYPEISPKILSDRINFPKNRLPHLYYSPENEPATLCLVRDNLNQWFATMTIADFLFVGSQWFYKAATGTLLNDNNEFDPVRLNYSLGKHVYKYETFLDIVINNRRLLDAYPMALVLGSFYDNELSKKNTFKSIIDIPFILINNLKSIISKVKNVKSDDTKFTPLYSILIWDPEQNIERNYFTRLPNNYKDLCEFLKIRGIDIISILSALKIAKVPIRIIITIIYSVKRPNKIIGYEGNYEFFTFGVIVPKNFPEDLDDSTEVYIASHSEPFSVKIAQILSNERREMKTLFIGAGSLGSKIIMHDARIGKKSFGVADNDNFEQHNLGRHVLYANMIGKNKAEAVIDEIISFYELDSTTEMISYKKSIIEIDEVVINNYDIIVDSTASQLVMQNLIHKNLKNDIIYTKCELVDDGALGLLYVEGNERNPRMDDLVNYACYLAINKLELEVWRRADAIREPDTLNIGLGCNSITTVMPDDLISFHASTFSQILASNPREKYNGNGLLYISVSRKKNGLPKISNEYIEIKPFEIYECGNNSGWTIRMLSGLSERLLKLCNRYGKKETGGVLVGVANYKTKVIHVFDIIEQPIDSNGSPVAFTRGIIGLPKQIDDIKLKTGEVIGYIGEWHTHPMNLETLSGTDLNTIEILKNINIKTPIPTCAVIVTQTKILPFIYD